MTVRGCAHERDYFDREVCHCGMMHYRCKDCGAAIDPCPAGSAGEGI